MLDSAGVLDASEPRVHGHRLAALGADVVGRDDEVVGIDELDLGAPLPVGPAVRIRIATKDGETALTWLPDAVHDGRVVVKAVHPAGLILVGGGVESESEHAVLGLTVNRGLVEIDGKATIEDELDATLRPGFTRGRIGIEPGARGTGPRSDQTGEEMMGASFGVRGRKGHVAPVPMITPRRSRRVFL